MMLMIRLSYFSNLVAAIKTYNGDFAMHLYVMDCTLIGRMVRSSS